MFKLLKVLMLGAVGLGFSAVAFSQTCKMSVINWPNQDNSITIFTNATNGANCQTIKSDDSGSDYCQYAEFDCATGLKMTFVNNSDTIVDTFIGQPKAGDPQSVYSTVNANDFNTGAIKVSCSGVASNACGA